MTPSVHHIVILPHIILLYVALFRLAKKNKMKKKMCSKLQSFNLSFINVMTVRQIYRNNRTNALSVLSLACNGQYCSD